MKKTFTLLSLLPTLALPCMGAISIDVFAGEFLNSSSSLVSDSSLWAIIYDGNNDGILPGGLGLNSNLTSANEAQAFSDFTGQQILTGGTIGMDKILWAGEVDGSGTSGTPGLGNHTLANFEFADLGVSANGNFAVYWFPQLTTASNTLGLSAVDVGGLQQTAVGGSGGDIGMVMPATDDTGTFFTAAFIDNGDNGGDVAPSRLTAITAIPEPSTALLALLGFAGILRRKR